MTQSDPINTDSPVHEHFELSYASYKVLPRTVLQSMPVWWQRAFVDLMDLLDEAGTDLPATDYFVQAGDWKSPDAMAPDRLRRLGYRWGPGKTVLYAADGHDLDPSRTCAFDPRPDPLPHYQRGRTRVPLREIQRPAWLPAQPEAE
ncbi:hypothetical protein IHN63_02060 [Deinococcus sp. 6YEL10]|uniref:hypothetical protein n=1 Tax=Deinococcus sp. 6YEL10 TaxID=2745870 RepID=UPI001E3C81F0|nr:hypothetical protein [Deinococcus sp. 6YEL10]MCD0160084.1 hypothetical protein [Deinococcus sp. 6YEL10]